MQDLTAAQQDKMSALTSAVATHFGWNDSEAFDAVDAQLSVPEADLDSITEQQMIEWVQLALDETEK